jgi:hypothetical protein
MTNLVATGYNSCSSVWTFRVKSAEILVETGKARLRPSPGILDSGGTLPSQDIAFFSALEGDREAT